MVPETYAPTSTVMTGSTAPVVVMVRTTEPRVTLGRDVGRLLGVPPPQEVPQRAHSDQPQRDSPRTGRALHLGRPPSPHRGDRTPDRGNTGKRYALGRTRDGSSFRSNGGASDRLTDQMLVRSMSSVARASPLRYAR